MWLLQDISFKVLRQMHTICRTSINQDGPWKLQQIQDAANHLQQAIGYIDNVDKHYVFRYFCFDILFPLFAHLVCN